MSGFTVIPAHGLIQTDTLRILDDNIEENIYRRNNYLSIIKHFY